MPRAPAIAALAAACLCSPAPSLGASAQGSLTASVGPGVDTNPTRTVGTDAQPDEFIGFSASTKGRLVLGDGQLLQARYDVGLRKFLHERDSGEDMAAQQVELAWTLQRGRLLLGADGALKWRLSRGRARDYGDGAGELFADWSFSREVSARLSAGAHLFRYWPTAGPQPDCGSSCYDWAGPQAVASLRWQPARQHVAVLSLFGALPYYRGWVRFDDGSYLPGWRRRDRQLGGQLSYGYKGPLAVQAGYTFARVDSTSFGEANERHRLWAAVSAKLPWRLFASAQAAWQFIRYPDGVFLSQSLLLLDDESQSSVAVKLALAVTDEIDLEARYAAYWILLPSSGDSAATTWLRHTAYLGLTVRL